jgi:hypothetical protein
MLSYTASKVVRTESHKQIGERTVKELAGKSKEEFLDSGRYETFVYKSLHVLVFQMIFDNPWDISVNHTDILQFLFCKQEFRTDLIPHMNAEGCVELHQYVPLQNYKEELSLVFVINVFAMTVMIMLLANLIKDLKMKSKVFPFMALTLTPIIMIHVFTIDVNLAEVVKLQI